MATDLGVSRGSVREAIKALESLGIVEVRHGDGVRVRAFNFDSTFDLLSYGLVFDPRASPRFSRFASGWKWPPSPTPSR